MKKLLLLVCAALLILSTAAIAQDTMQQGDNAKKDTMKSDTMKSDNMKSDHMAKKTVTVSGKVSDDGMTFMSEKDSKNWKVANPEALKGHEGHQVKVKAHLDADNNEIHVVSVKMAKGEMKDTSMKKDDMKKDEMQH